MLHFPYWNTFISAFAQTTFTIETFTLALMISVGTAGNWKGGHFELPCAAARFAIRARTQRRSATAGSTFIPDLTEATRPLQEANNTQVDSNTQWRNNTLPLDLWSWNPFALATGSGAQ